MLSMFFAAMRNNQEFYQNVGRSYLLSIPFNISELLVFGGTAALLLFLFKAPVGFGAVWRAIMARTAPSQATAFTVALAISLLLVLLGGGVRGELARNCMALTPLLAVAAFSSCAIGARGFLLFGVFCLVQLCLSSWLLEVNVLFRMGG